MANSVFSVSASNKVKFTQGNLQYIYVDGTNNYWQFAPTQFSYLGSNQGSGTSTVSGKNFDLFGWGAIPAADGTMQCIINNNNYYPCGTKTTKTEVVADWISGATAWAEPTDYTTDLTRADLNNSNYLDWGRYINKMNQTIYIDKDYDKYITQPTGGYRVLTASEWGYLLDTRTFSDDTSTKMWEMVTVTLAEDNTKKSVVL